MLSALLHLSATQPTRFAVPFADRLQRLHARQPLRLWLSLATVSVITAATAVLLSGDLIPWRVAAWTAFVVSVLDGVLFWGFLQWETRARAAVLIDVQEMMADQVKNQLAVINLSLSMSNADHEAVGLVNESLDAITTMIDSLSEESVSSWKTHYREAVAHCTECVPA
ncbi:MAG: hypothetical protein RhofKO_07650 [Rhodothermales bacterium]